MKLVKEASQHLRSKVHLVKEKVGPGTIDRQEIVAYSILCAYRDHFPEEIGAAEKALIKKWQKIEDLEYDRYVKQRRIALSALAEEWRSKQSLSLQF